MMKKPWDLQPGLELDEAVGKAMGIGPRIEWMVSDDGGRSLCLCTDPYGRTKPELEEWLAEKKRNFPDRFARHEVLRWEIWPLFSKSLPIVITTFDLLVERGFAPTLFRDGTWGCTIRRLGTEERVCEMCQADTDPDSPALAISRAIVAADQRWPGALRGEERDG